MEYFAGTISSIINTLNIDLKSVPTNWVKTMIFILVSETPFDIVYMCRKIV